MKDVPYIAFESELARLERVIKKMFILLVVTVCLLVGTNAYWIWHEAQFTDEITVTQDNTDGVNNYIGDDGDITNGEADDN